MLSEIGSNFWLNPNQNLSECHLGTPKQFNCKGSDFVWLSTGRSAIKYVIKAIEERARGIKKVAVLPSYTCHTVFEPFIEMGYEIYYYPIEKDLTTSSNAILETVLKHNASIILFHRYFGFDTLNGQINRMCDILRGLGKFTVEDCTQCLYSGIPRAYSDFTVGSIRKWAGTPDGGFAVCHSGVFKDKPEKYDSELESAKIKASYAKYRYLFEKKGNKADMLAQFRAAEDILDHQQAIFAISPMSARVQASLNVEELINKRKNNFNILRTSLKGLFQPLFSLDSNQTVPLYFPILVEDRSALQKYLVQNAIYAPIVWPKDVKQPEQCDGAEYMYEHLLCIPIDQRYDADEMNCVVEVVNKFYAHGYKQKVGHMGRTPAI